MEALITWLAPWATSPHPKALFERHLINITKDPYHSQYSGNSKVFGSSEPETVDEDQIFETCFGHLNDQIDISYESQYCTNYGHSMRSPRQRLDLNCVTDSGIAQTGLGGSEAIFIFLRAGLLEAQRIHGAPFLN